MVRAPPPAGRSFLLWLAGVVLVTLVLASAVVLRHEQQILEAELVARAEMVAATVGLSVADAGSPKLLTVVSLAEVRAGEARRPDGAVLWRYGPELDEAMQVDGGSLRLVRRVALPEGPRPSGEVVVELVVSRSGIARQLAASAVRVVGALGLALTATFLAGLAFVARFVDPLRRLASVARGFDPDRGETELPEVRGTTAEVDDLARAFRDMVTRLDAERRSLAASERRYRELFAGSPTPLLEIDHRLRVRDANPAAVAFLGGIEPGDPVLSRLGGPARDAVGERLAAAVAAGDGVVEARGAAAGGPAAELELHVRRLGDETALVAVHDLTERVRRLGERWQRTFDAMVDGVALLQPDDGRVASANRAIRPHLDDVRPEAAGRMVDAPTAWRAVSRDRVLDCTLTVPADLGLGVLVVRDSTERVRAEERLRDAEKMEAIGRLARGVAHDFNNLLAGIQLHGRVLERTEGADRDAVAAIRELAEEGEEVVRELLLFARSESTPPRPLDLAALVAGQEGVLRHLVPAEVALEVEVPREPVPVVASPVALRRMLLNLALNARDAVAELGGRVAIRVAARAGSASLEVEDDGPGIDDAQRERLFEPFYSRRRQGRGAGLGLAVVYAIVREHGGTVEVRSAPGAGTCFSVELPLAVDVDLEPEDARPATRVRVLLLEPEARIADRLLRELTAVGFDPRHAATPESCRDVVAGWRPQVVVASSSSAARTDLGRFGAPVVWLGSGPPDEPVLPRHPDPGAVAAAVRRIVPA